MHVSSTEVEKQEGKIKCFISLYNLKSEWFLFYYTLQIGSWSALWCDDFNIIIIIALCCILYTNMNASCEGGVQNGKVELRRSRIWWQIDDIFLSNGINLEIWILNLCGVYFEEMRMIAWKCLNVNEYVYYIQKWNNS